MKSNTFFFAAFIFALLSFMSCDSKPGSKTDAQPDAKTKIKTSYFESNLPPSCLYIENNRDGSQNQRINSMCADTLIRNYQRDIELIKTESSFPDIDKLLTYGAKVDIASISTIVDKITEGNYDEVYAMNAAVAGEKSSIIFVLINSTTNEKAFYNFTLPCPDLCPDLIN